MAWPLHLKRSRSANGIEDDRSQIAFGAVHASYYTPNTKGGGQGREQEGGVQTQLLTVPIFFPSHYFASIVVA